MEETTLSTPENTPYIATKKDVRALPTCFCLFTLHFWVLLEGASMLLFSAVWLLFIAAATLYVRVSPTAYRTPITTLFYIGAVIFTPILPLTDSAGLRFSVFALQVFSLMLWLAFSFGHGGSQRRLADLLIAFASLFAASIEGIFSLGEGIAAYRTQRKAEKAEQSQVKRPFPWGIVGGFLLSIPVLCILIPLLSTADAAFEGIVAGWDEMFVNFIDNIFRSLGTLIAALFLSAIVFYPVCGTLFSLGRERGKGESVNAPILPCSLLLGFYGSIALLCIVYLFSQLSYLFSGFMGALPVEMTAAEYARRGFFEIFTVSVLMLGIIGVGVLLAKGDGYRKLLTAIIVFLSAFDLLLIATALAKMILYMRLYGLTVKRLIVSATLILLAIIFATILLRRFLPKFRSLPVVLAAALILFGIPAFADPHRMVAEYNVWAWEEGHLSTIDTQLFYDLSDAAIPALIRVYESENAEASNNAATVLSTIYSQKCAEYGVDYGALLPTDLTMENYSISRAIAHHALNQISGELTIVEEVYDY